MFFYVLLVLFGTISSKWKIKFVNDTNVSLEPGVFYPINIYLETSTPYKAITNLNLTGGPIKTSESRYELNTFLKVNYTIYIGVPCSTAIGQYKLNFTIDNTKEFVFDKNLTINVIPRENPIDISVHLLNNKISAKTYSMYYILSYDLVNVDPISFTFTNNTPVNSAIENKKMPPYSTIIPRFFRGYYNATSETNVSQNYSVSIDNQCYRLLNQTISFSITPYKEKNITTYKTSIIKQFEAFERDQSSISFNLIIPISPTIVNCIAVANTSKFPSNDEIRNGHLTQQPTPYKKYFNYFIREAQQNITVKFEGLSSLRQYRIQCIVDSAVIHEPNRTSAIVTIGNFYNADIFIDTTPNPKLPIITQCMTFNFDGDIGLAEFNRKLIDYCENYFYSKYNKPSSLNGCVRCIKRNIPLENYNENGICIIGEEVCETKFQGNIVKDIQKLKEDLPNTKEIKFKLGINNISNLISSISESDQFEVENRYSEYIFGYTDILDNIIPNNSVDLTFKNTHTKKDFDCFLLDFTVNIPYKNLTKEDFIDNSIKIFLHKKQLDNLIETKLKVNFTDQIIDNNIYPIVVKCFPLAYTDYRLNESPNLLLNSFLKTNKTIPADTLVPKKDCEITKNKNESECLNKKYYRKREYLYVHKEDLFVNKDLITLKDNFLELNYKPKKLKVIIEEEKLHTLPEYTNITTNNFENYLQQYILVNELLKNCDCNLFPGYDLCRNWKRSITSNLTDHLFGIINITNFTTFINSTLLLLGSSEEDHYYNKTILLYITLYDLTTHPEAISKTNLKNIHKFTDFMFEAIHSLIKNNTETTIKHRENVLYIMLSTYFNLIEISRFESIYIKDRPDIEHPKLISDSSLVNMYTKIHELLIMIMNQIKLTSKSLQITYNRNYIYLFNSKYDIEETISRKIGDGSVSIKLNPINLINEDKNKTTQYISVIIFNIYPFLSEEDASTLGTFISINPLSSSGTINNYPIHQSFRPEITFENDYATDTPIEYKYIKCIFIDQNYTGKVDLSNIESDILNSEENNIKCLISRTGDLTLQRGYVISNYRVWIIISIIVLIVIGIGSILFCIAKKNVSKAMRKKITILDSGYKTIDSGEDEETVEDNNNIQTGTTYKDEHFDYDEL